MGSPSRFSRRAFIGLAAGAAAAPVMTAGCQSAASGGAPKSGANLQLVPVGVVKYLHVRKNRSDSKRVIPLYRPLPES